MLAVRTVAVMIGGPMARLRFIVRDYCFCQKNDQYPSGANNDVCSSNSSGENCCIISDNSHFLALKNKVWNIFRSDCCLLEISFLYNYFPFFLFFSIPLIDKLTDKKKTKHFTFFFFFAAFASNKSGKIIFGYLFSGIISCWYNNKLLKNNI